jgi:uncharacterized lipoprotein YehR (DUF1307 family)
MSFTSDYLLYTKGDLINNVKDVVTNSFYQIDNKNQVNISATDANVYYLDKIMKENATDVYYFNPMKEHTFDNKSGVITKAGDKTPNIPHLTKKITATDLLTKYNIYKVFVQLNRGSFLSYVPIVGSSINTGLGFVPGSGLLTDTLNVTKNIGTGTANALIGRGGYGKRKRKTNKNNRKTRKTRKTRKPRKTRKTKK